MVSVIFLLFSDYYSDNSVHGTVYVIFPNDIFSTFYPTFTHTPNKRTHKTHGNFKQKPVLLFFWKYIFNYARNYYPYSPFSSFLVTSCNLQQRNTQTKVLKITKKFRLYFLQFRFYQQKTHIQTNIFLKYVLMMKKHTRKKKTDLVHILFSAKKSYQLPDL